jgi:hypothetical protein
MNMRCRRARAVVIAFLLSTPQGSIVLAVDFIRGDANGDGVVTISDSQAILERTYRQLQPRDCQAAFDTTFDGRINLTDGVFLLNYFYLGGPEIPSPFPEMGPAPDGSALGCAEYGGGAPLEDPRARLALLSASTPGGTAGKATLLFGIASSSTVAAYSLRFAVPEAVIAVEEFPVDLTGTLHEDGRWRNARLENGVVTASMLFSFVPEVHVLPPSALVRPVVEVRVCLARGTPAGEYPITLLDAEFADPATGRAVHPQLTGGTLVVGSEVTTAGNCARTGPNEDPPEPIGPTEVAGNVVFRIADAAVLPGEAISLPLTIEADGGVQGFVFSVDFDEELLTATAVRRAWQIPGGYNYRFFVAAINNNNATPGSGGLDEGYLGGAAIFAFDQYVAMPANEPVEAVRLEFQVHQDAPDTTTQVRFMDGARIEPHEPFINAVATGGTQIVPNLSGSFLTVDCNLAILPIVDITVFVRGDSSGDGTVNLTDAQRTLNYLFLHGPRPHCFDAADANDDGTINITDPIFALGHLFLGTARTLPPPYPGVGPDPTADGMTCATQG